MIVTFTGVDEQTNVDKLVELANKYDFIEFGVLLSETITNKEANNRFPSLEFIDKLIEAGLPLSCHICGRLAREFIKTGDFTEIQNFLTPQRINHFKRIQLNINGCREYAIFELPQGINFILQVCDNKSYRYYWEMNRLEANADRIGALMDKSGGKGALDAFNSVADTDEYFGYAGGISKDNVAYNLGYIDGRNENHRDYWINMETCIRDKANWFDVSKVEEICEICDKIIRSKG